MPTFYSTNSDGLVIASADFRFTQDAIELEPGKQIVRDRQGQLRIVSSDEEAAELQAPTPEELAAAIRAERDALLSATDKYMASDYPITAEQLAEVKAYRQALRDVPQQAGFPQGVVWPEAL